MPPQHRLSHDSSGQLRYDPGARHYGEDDDSLRLTFLRLTRVDGREADLGGGNRVQAEEFADPRQIGIPVDKGPE